MGCRCRREGPLKNRPGLLTLYAGDTVHMRENPCGWALDPAFPTRPGIGVTAKPFTALARWWERRFEWRRRLQAGGRDEKKQDLGGWHQAHGGGSRGGGRRPAEVAGVGIGTGVLDRRAPGGRYPRGPSVGSPRGGPPNPGARGLRLLPAGLAAAGPSPGAGSLADPAPASLPPAAAARRPISQAAGPRARLRPSPPPAEDRLPRPRVPGLPGRGRSQGAPRLPPRAGWGKGS